MIKITCSNINIKIYLGVKMKRIALILMVISVIALIGLGACGGNGGDDETTTQTTEATTTEQTTTTESSNGGGGGGGLTWNDMPIYGGADQIQKGSWSIPADEGGYSEVEWRYYETGDDVEDVIAFYKDKMPDNGWGQIDVMGWMETEGMAWGMYMKNNEADAAMIWMMEEDGDTVIALMRATE